VTPFTVLHVCMGNICRSPMADVLLATRLREAAGVDGLVRSHSVGTGGWHVGQRMNPPAARQVSARGGDPDTFRARQLEIAHLKDSDLVLTATAEQVEYVLELAPDAAPHTFVLGEFGRLIGPSGRERDRAAAIDPAELPPYAPTVEAVAARGRALVAAADKVRDGAWPRPGDDLDDPYGRSDAFFGRTADQIEDALTPLVRLLVR
jgi:protein-tyrosine phosphatase